MILTFGDENIFVNGYSIIIVYNCMIVIIIIIIVLYNIHNMYYTMWSHDYTVLAPSVSLYMCCCHISCSCCLQGRSSGLRMRVYFIAVAVSLLNITVAASVYSTRVH